MRGSIFLVGKFPAFKTEPDGIVHGELWRLHDPSRTLAALDDYEGGEYPRMIVDLETPRTRAWIYVYPGDVRTRKRIESGDFLAP